ncbi:MAG TPA: DUF305 domain-containing protein [Streptomyces sp.]|nr:DUF305 domain-containing protein [Streptomyces sp.]
MAGLVAAAVLGLTGCDSGPGTEAAGASGPSVIAPGRPGEDNRTLSPDEAEARRGDDSPNAADVAYARMMIRHHAQALEMTALVPERAASTKVEKLAGRIAAAQGPEIGAMRGWLKNHGKKEQPGAHGGHGHAGMPGMVSETRLKDLRAADGEAFDRLFLTLMITHHEGAVTMATDVKGQGNNVQIEEMADDVIAQQTSEITRMRELM